MRVASISMFVFLVSMLSVSVWSNPYSDRDSISGKMINNYLASSADFPIVKNVKGVTANFLGPELDILVLDKKAKLRMLITSMSGEQVLVIRAFFDGELEYYEFNDTLRFKDLELDRFHVLQDTFIDRKPIIKVIRQEMLFSLRDVVLFDVKNLKLDASKDVPKEIEIAVNKLILHW